MDNAIFNSIEKMVEILKYNPLVLRLASTTMEGNF